MKRRTARGSRPHKLLAGVMRRLRGAIPHALVLALGAVALLMLAGCSSSQPTAPALLDLKYEVCEYAAPGGLSPNCRDFSQPIAIPEDGWQIDRTKGDADHSGISAGDIEDNQTSKDSLRNYHFEPGPDGNSFVVSGTICGDAGGGGGAIFDRFYVIHLTLPPSAQHPVPPASLLDLKYDVREYVDPAGLLDPIANCQDFTRTLAVPDGWQIDYFLTQGDDGHPGINDVGNADNQNSLRRYNYKANPGGRSFQVSGRLCGQANAGGGAIFDHSYVVHLLSWQPHNTLDVTYEVKAHADPGFSSPVCQDFSQTLAVPDGWQIASTAGDLPGHPGISQVQVADNQTAQNSLRSYFYGPDTGGNAFLVTGTICYDGKNSAQFDRFYVIHLTHP